jgi:hypothetical protein
MFSHIRYSSTRNAFYVVLDACSFYEYVIHSHAAFVNSYIGSVTNSGTAIEYTLQHDWELVSSYTFFYTRSI